MVKDLWGQGGVGLIRLDNGGKGGVIFFCFLELVRVWFWVFDLSGEAVVMLELSLAEFKLSQVVLTKLSMS
jgi:hypothetical protein